MSGASPPRYAVRAVAHVHSTHSDGTATVPELRRAVRAAGAEVLLLTDHDTLGARDACEDGWGDGVLVVVGHEVSPRHGHLLVFGTPEPIGHAGRDETAILDAVAGAGGFGIAAHPFSTGSAMSRRIGRPHGWSSSATRRWRGSRSGASRPTRRRAGASPAAALRGLRHPEAAVLGGPPPGHLERWDSIAAAGPRGGLGGQDGHAPGLRVGGRVRSILPHARWLPLVQTVLDLAAPLTGDDAADRATVLRTLRAGATTVAVPPLGDPLGGRAAFSTVPRPGGRGPAAGCRLEVDAPAATTVRLLRDGRVVLEADARDAPFAVDAPGLHRVELRRAGPDGGAAVPWLLPSPVALE